MLLYAKLKITIIDVWKLLELVKTLEYSISVQATFLYLLNCFTEEHSQLKVNHRGSKENWKGLIVT